MHDKDGRDHLDRGYGFETRRPSGGCQCPVFLTERNEACADLLQPEFDSCKKKKKRLLFSPSCGFDV